MYLLLAGMEVMRNPLALLGAPKEFRIAATETKLLRLPSKIDHKQIFISLISLHNFSYDALIQKCINWL